MLLGLLFVLAVLFSNSSRLQHSQVVANGNILCQFVLFFFLFLFFFVFFFSASVRVSIASLISFSKSDFIFISPRFSHSLLIVAYSLISSLSPLFSPCLFLGLSRSGFLHPLLCFTLSKQTDEILHPLLLVVGRKQ